jgi:hypothetical protein
MQTIQFSPSSPILASQRESGGCEYRRFLRAMRRLGWHRVRLFQERVVQVLGSWGGGGEVWLATRPFSESVESTFMDDAWKVHCTSIEWAEKRITQNMELESVYNCSQHTELEARSEPSMKVRAYTRSSGTCCRTPVRISSMTFCVFFVVFQLHLHMLPLIVHHITGAYRTAYHTHTPDACYCFDSEQPQLSQRYALVPKV